MPGQGNISSTNAAVIGGGGGPAPSAPVNTSAPVIGWSGSGDGHIDDIAEVVTAGVWTGADSVVGRWYFNGAEVTLAAVIEAQANGAFTYKETATNAVGDTLSPASNALTTLTTALPTNTTAPVATYDGINASVISDGIWLGNPRPSGYTYQWSIDLNDGNGFAEITGATSQSINAASFTSGLGMSLFCSVNAFNNFGGTTHQQGANSNMLT